MVSELDVASLVCLREGAGSWGPGSSTWVGRGGQAGPAGNTSLSGLFLLLFTC